MNDVQNRRILALLNMLYYALGNRTTCDICHKYFILVLSVMNNLTINYGGNDSNLLIVFYVQIMPDDLVMQLHRF